MFVQRYTYFTQNLNRNSDLLILQELLYRGEIDVNI